MPYLFHASRARLLPFNFHAISQALDLGRLYPASNKDLILLLNSITWVGEAEREVAVVREKQQARSIGIEPADRVDTNASLLKVGSFNHVKHCRATVGVLRGRNDAFWLIQRKIDGRVLGARLLHADGPSINSDLVGSRLSAASHLGNHMPVQGYSPGRDDLFCRPARGDSSRSEYFL